MSLRFRLLAVVFAALLLGGCGEEVRGDPDRARARIAGPSDLAVPIELAPVLTDPTATPASQLPDPDGNALRLGPSFLTITRLERGEVRPDQNTGHFVINLTLTDEDGATFGEWTGGHVGEQAAMVVDGEVVAAPRIESAITGGALAISAQYDRDEAEGLFYEITGR